MSASTTSHQTNRLRIFVGRCLTNLQAPWTNVKNDLSPDLMKCLEFWDELIKKDETVISNKELNDLLVSLRELRNQIEAIDSNPELKRVLAKIVEVLIRGIIDYHLVGEDAVRNAAREAFSFILTNEDLIRNNSDCVPVKSLALVWDKFMHACQTVIFADGLIHAAGTAIQIGGGFLKLIGHNAGP